MRALTPQARAFVNRFQGGFPIAGRPFHGVAANLGMPETVLIQTVRQLLDEGLLSRFGPLYDATRLGGAASWMRSFAVASAMRPISVAR